MREFQSRHIPRPNIKNFDATRLTEQPLDLEIGAGQGLHAIQYCLKHPRRNLLAIERTQVKFAALTSRLEHHKNLTNLHAVRADAISVVVHCLPDKSLTNVFLLYPNPYPKSRQANQRWHRHPFIQCLHAKMTTNSKLTLATNLRWYADEAQTWLERENFFRLTRWSELQLGHLPRTHFEKKYLERGETCFDLTFEKLVQ